MADDPKSRLTSDQCRAQAEICREMARAARSPAHRTMLEHMAETWLRIAGDVQTDNEASDNGGGRK
jgi:hypothetical protein